MEENLNQNQINALKNAYEELSYIHKHYQSDNLLDYPFEELEFILEHMKTHFKVLQKHQQELEELQNQE
jgi:hypothetical protein